MECGRFQRRAIPFWDAVPKGTWWCCCAIHADNHVQQVGSCWPLDQPIHHSFVDTCGCFGFAHWSQRKAYQLPLLFDLGDPEGEQVGESWASSPQFASIFDNRWLGQIVHCHDCHGPFDCCCQKIGHHWCLQLEREHQAASSCIGVEMPMWFGQARAKPTWGAFHGPRFFCAPQAMHHWSHTRSGHIPSQATRYGHWLVDQSVWCRTARM